MFKVHNTILSDNIATARFACDVTRCKGACCVVGDAGAPVSKDEIPVLKKAFRLLRDELNPEAVEIVEEDGLIKGNIESGYEINCRKNEECVFVTYNGQGIAECAIQKAFYEGRINWEKPLSCHLYPIRLKKVVDFEYANFEYIPTLCGAGCARGEEEGIWLSDFLKEPLIRRYGETWYAEFLAACEKIRKEERETKNTKKTVEA